MRGRIETELEAARGTLPCRLSSDTSEVSGYIDMNVIFQIHATNHPLKVFFTCNKKCMLRYVVRSHTIKVYTQGQNTHTHTHTQKQQPLRPWNFLPDKSVFVCLKPWAMHYQFDLWGPRD